MYPSIFQLTEKQDTYADHDQVHDRSRTDGPPSLSAHSDFETGTAGQANDTWTYIDEYNVNYDETTIRNHDHAQQQESQQFAYDRQPGSQAPHGPALATASTQYFEHQRNDVPPWSSQPASNGFFDDSSQNTDETLLNGLTSGTQPTPGNIVQSRFDQSGLQAWAGNDILERIQLTGDSLHGHPNFHPGPNDRLATPYYPLLQPRVSPIRPGTASATATRVFPSSPETPFRRRPSASATLPSSTSPSYRRRSGEELEVGDYRCQDCRYAFPTQGALNQHRRRHVSREEWQHVCVECGRRCQFAKDLRRHASTHRTGDDHLFYCHVAGCRTAGRGFSRWDNYTRHLRNQHRLLPTAEDAVSGRGTGQRA